MFVRVTVSQAIQFTIFWLDSKVSLVYKDAKHLARILLGKVRVLRSSGM